MQTMHELQSQAQKWRLGTDGAMAHPRLDVYDVLFWFSRYHDCKFDKCLPAGQIGEHPIGIPNNLMPYIQQVVLGQREFLSVYGHDYQTRDGTCIRDYIHVMDLADGHVKAVDKLFNTKDIGCVAYNLGTGNGSTVLEMIKV